MGNGAHRHSLHWEKVFLKGLNLDKKKQPQDQGSSPVLRHPSHHGPGEIPGRDTSLIHTNTITKNILTCVSLDDPT